jgi:hypothetical protein
MHPNVRLAQNKSTLATVFATAVKTVASTGTPEALAAAGTLCSSVLIVPKRGNTTAVYIGSSATNDAQHVLVGATGVLLTAPHGTRIDLGSIYVDVATNGEGVAYEAMN